MCNRCSDDPRDGVAQAEAALAGLRLLINELPADADLQARNLGPIIDLIHDRLDPAVTALQDFAPRNA